MSPVNHLLTGWLVANTNSRFSARERLAIMVGCLIPDLDGLGIVADVLTEGSKHPLTWWEDFHHVLGHSLLFGLIFALAVFVISQRNWWVTGFSFLTFHLHLFEDLISGRKVEGETWAIQYLYPISDVEIAWSGQIALNAWPNFVVVIIFLIATFYLAWKRGYSPLESLSQKADKDFVRVLRLRFGSPRQEG